MLGNSVYSVVWLPASVLRGVEVDAGEVSLAALERDRPEVVRLLQERWRLFDGAEQAETVRIDLILQPPDDAPPGRGDRADQLVMLHHARFSHPPGRVELATDLFTRGGAGPALTVNATRDHESETATFGPERTRYRFFGGSPALAPSRSSRLLQILAPAMLALLAWACTRRRRITRREPWNVV